LTSHDGVSVVTDAGVGSLGVSVVTVAGGSYSVVFERKEEKNELI